MFAISTSCLHVSLFLYFGHDTLYTIYIQQCTTVLYIYWYLYLVPGIHYGERVLHKLGGNAEVYRTVRIGLMACMKGARTSIEIGYLHCFFQVLNT